MSVFSNKRKEILPGNAKIQEVCCPVEFSTSKQAGLRDEDRRMHSLSHDTKSGCVLHATAISYNDGEVGSAFLTRRIGACHSGPLFCAPHSVQGVADWRRSSKNGASVTPSSPIAAPLPSAWTVRGTEPIRRSDRPGQISTGDCGSELDRRFRGSRQLAFCHEQPENDEGKWDQLRA
jgi:hypothetical protein